MSCNGVEIY